ncbi:hypothetical protein HMPREF9621_01898 [Cutibacterium modestum HL037PA2]|uniref:Uncharacterized protein n=1 Tax=Cutibacterium modestum HL044PA1 TaxID=765109 RepID=A0ABN0C834_9ACTN|nr:hypothetical protein HMPREF9621_01898 [Cutibacterium modestum HL037PA2]EFS93457.1 hypothetical protein HMPREF9607_00377 [Cutibacterium modestum HL044PA1]
MDKPVIGGRCRARSWPHDEMWGLHYEGPTVGMGWYQVTSR